MLIEHLIDIRYQILYLYYLTLYKLENFDLFLNIRGAYIIFYITYFLFLIKI
jgi:hypothetical protein